jgi:hypothetical protein
MKKDCWVSPTGKVTHVCFAQHNEIAYKIIDEKGWREDFEKWELNNMSRYAADYLQEERKYIRYCDWGAQPKWVTNDTPPTKKQQQRMFEIDNEE